MTKKQAENYFRAGFPEVVKSDDKPLRQFSWSSYTDGLFKDGQITSNQYHRWRQPKFICK